MVLLRRRIDLVEVPLDLATVGLSAAQVPIQAPFYEDHVRTKKQRRAILDLWALEDGV